jgi:ferritin-like metal-binding protein YciE
MNDKALVPVEQKTVVFYGDELVAIRAEDGQIYVSFRHLCNALGLDRASQVQRIKRHEILNEGYEGGAMMASPGGQQRAGVLVADLVPLWLAGIDTKRVKPEIQDKLKRYQREAAKVLWEAFQEGRLTSDPTFDELLQTDSEAVQAYKMIQAMLKLARNQILLESRLDKHETQLVGFEERLEQVEITLGDPGRQVTPEQASQISQAVKAVAMKLSEQSGRNEYGGVYGELYRKFSITSYKLLPAKKFEEAMSWLTEWHQSVVGDEPF